MIQLALGLDAKLTTEAFVERVKRDYAEDDYIVFSSIKPLTVGGLIPMDSTVSNPGVNAVLKQCRWLVTSVATLADICSRTHDAGSRYWYRAVPTD
jgi:hypothetical protein